MYFTLKDKLESPLEDMFLKDCITVGLRVIPQVRFGKYRVDFFVPDYNLVLEIDGKDWHSSKEQIEHDNKKNYYLVWKRFMRVIRINGSSAYSRGEEIAAEIKEFILSDEFLNNRIGLWGI